MLKERVITGVALIAGFLLAVFFLPDNVFRLLLAVVAAGAAYEWTRLIKLRDDIAQSVYTALVGLIAMVCLYVPGVGLAGALAAAGFLFWLTVPVLFYRSPVREPILLPSGRLLLVGVAVIVFATTSIHYLRNGAAGTSVDGVSPALLLYAMSVVWTMDIGAYFSGRRFGKNKLAPRISPGKTWEGVYGGLAVTLLVLVIVLFATDLPTLKTLLAVVFASVASVLGDLFESRIKRAADMKDSGTLLPGHGGILDRIDGVLAATPVFAFFWIWL